MCFCRDYPDFYKKLYNLLEPSIFHVKYRARFFHLANLFLSSRSDHPLPASFVPPQSLKLQLISCFFFPVVICVKPMFVEQYSQVHSGSNSICSGFPRIPSVCGNRSTVCILTSVVCVFVRVVTCRHTWWRHLQNAWLVWLSLHRPQPSSLCCPSSTT